MLLIKTLIEGDTHQNRDKNFKQSTALELLMKAPTLVDQQASKPPISQQIAVHICLEITQRGSWTNAVDSRQDYCVWPGGPPTHKMCLQVS
jgi:hypothetical protein